MVSKTMKVNIPTDAEARPVAVLVQIASQYNSAVYIQSEDKKINAKSIMGMMSLGVKIGEEITVVADGDDEQKAIDSLSEYLSSAKK